MMMMLLHPVRGKVLWASVGHWRRASQQLTPLFCHHRNHHEDHHDHDHDHEGDHHDHDQVLQIPIKCDFYCQENGDFYESANEEVTTCMCLNKFLKFFHPLF